MNCFDETEAVIDYIESNILIVTYDEISKFVGIPIGLYQRIFSYVCNISIAEYIKKRRLTLAANELMLTNQKVIDIGLKYGYDSHASFSRAFKEQIGISPSLVKDNQNNLKLYAKFSFQNNDETYYVVKGKRIMAALERIEYEYYGERKLIGLQRRTDFSKAGLLWKEYFEIGISDSIKEYEAYECKDLDDYIGLGHMCNFDEAGTIFDYTIGKYVMIDTPNIKGMSEVNIPSGIIAKARIKGKFHDIINNAYFLITEAIRKNGYMIDYDNFYWCDVYTFERYCEPADRGEEILILDYFMPCKKE